MRPGRFLPALVALSLIAVGVGPCPEPQIEIPGLSAPVKVRTVTSSTASAVTRIMLPTLSPGKSRSRSL